MAKTRVNVYQLEPGTNGQVIKTSGGVAVWSSDSAGILPGNVFVEEIFYGDGAATSFTLANASVVIDTMQVYVDGVRQAQGATLDYTASVNGLFVFVAGNTPEATQTIIVDYRIVE